MRQRSTSRRPNASTAGRHLAFDLLPTMVAVVDDAGVVRFANAALEDALGLSRSLLAGTLLAAYFFDSAGLAQAVDGARRNAFGALRYDAQLRRQGGEAVLVHVVVACSDQPNEIIVQMLPQEQQARQEREARLAEQSRANKELFRNLAHEIKNPLGGIRGAAQLLEMDIDSPALREYTQVIIHESDRLQSLVDRLLAPHRQAKVVTDTNIHEICERVRALILAEHPRGLNVVRDYDLSIPDFRADREQLIQAVLNIAQNAAQALSARIAAENAEIVLRTRVARQITFAGQRYRLALELHVIDNGPGLPDSIRDHVFLPLVSGRDGGSGLGLTLAQTFVQQHHGSIEVDSRPGRTDFRILIPLL